LQKAFEAVDVVGLGRSKIQQHRFAFVPFHAADQSRVYAVPESLPGRLSYHGSPPPVIASIRPKMYGCNAASQSIYATGLSFMGAGEGHSPRCFRRAEAWGSLFPQFRASPPFGSVRTACLKPIGLGCCDGCNGCFSLRETFGMLVLPRGEGLGEDLLGTSQHFVVGVLREFGAEGIDEGWDCAGGHGGKRRPGGFEVGVGLNTIVVCFQRSPDRLNQSTVGSVVNWAD